jgi:hypothetical protein
MGLLCLLLYLLLLGPLMAGCVRFSWERESRFEPPEPSVIENLQAGKTDLTQALAELGAPLWVWEYPSLEGQGAALAYGWYQNQDRGLRVSIPVVRGLSPSFSYGRIDRRMRGLVLFFNEDWKLAGWRKGLLQDLTTELVRRRPVYMDTSEQP